MQSTHNVLFRFPLRGSLNNAVQPGPRAMPLKSGAADTCPLDRQQVARTNCAIKDKSTYGTKDASDVARRRRVASVARGTVLPATLTFTSNSQRGVVDAALRRVRAGGAVVPPKLRVAPHTTQDPGFASRGKPLVRSRQGRALLATHPAKQTTWI